MSRPVSDRLTLTIPEVGHLLGVSTQSLYNHLDKKRDVIRTGGGELPVIRIGERVAVPKNLVAELLNATVAQIDAMFIERVAS